jgi:hypothetical protein
MKTKNKANINLLGIAGLIIALSVGYYFVIFLPKNAEEKLKQAEDAKTQERVSEYYRQASIDKCFTEAEAGYTSNWNTSCKLNGLKELCSLPSSDADTIEELRKVRKEECLKRYPQR